MRCDGIRCVVKGCDGIGEENEGCVFMQENEVGMRCIYTIDRRGVTW